MKRSVAARFALFGGGPSAQALRARWQPAIDEVFNYVDWARALRRLGPCDRNRTSFCLLPLDESYNEFAPCAAPDTPLCTCRPAFVLNEIGVKLGKPEIERLGVVLQATERWRKWRGVDGSSGFSGKKTTKSLSLN